MNERSREDSQHTNQKFNKKRKASLDELSSSFDQLHLKKDWKRAKSVIMTEKTLLHKAISSDILSIINTYVPLKEKGNVALTAKILNESLSSTREMVIDKDLNFQHVMNLKKQYPNIVKFTLLYEVNDNLFQWILRNWKLKQLYIKDFYAGHLLPSLPYPLEIKIDHLLFDGSFNEEIVENLPEGLQKLTLGGLFNQKMVKKVLPMSLTHLNFGSQFNQQIGEGFLPEGLTHLAFGDNFNYPIGKGVLPRSLIHLNFGWEFNQQIGEGVLPTSLTHLTFGRNFNQQIGEGVLPESLQKLDFGGSYRMCIHQWYLPRSLLELTWCHHPLKPELWRMILPGEKMEPYRNWQFIEEDEIFYYQKRPLK